PPPGAFTATWSDRFPGACVTSRLHLTTDPNGEFAGQAPQVLGFTPRAALEEALSLRSQGRLQLDPGEARRPTLIRRGRGTRSRKAAAVTVEQAPAAGGPRREGSYR